MGTLQSNRKERETMQKNSVEERGFYTLENRSEKPTKEPEIVRDIIERFKSIKVDHFKYMGHEWKPCVDIPEIYKERYAYINNTVGLLIIYARIKSIGYREDGKLSSRSRVVRKEYIIPLDSGNLMSKILSDKILEGVNQIKMTIL